MSDVPLLDLKAQYAPLRERIERTLCRIAADQAFILGPEVEGLEREVADYVGCGHAIGCASGTDALILTLAGVGLGSPDDEVLTTPFSFFATASCATRAGARPAFADIDPETFNLDPEAAAAAVGPRTRALLPVHLFGQCADMDAFRRLAEKTGLPLIEDAAQALGARFAGDDGREFHAGTMGTAGCYSFFPTKNLGGFGDGGMIVTDDDVLADRLRKLRVHGGQQMYHHEFVGWNSRLDAIQAAILRIKLPELDGWSRARAGNAALYDEAFEALASRGCVVRPVRDPRVRHIFNQYTIRVERRDALREHLRRHGIGHSVYYPVPLHLQDCFSDLGYARGAFPVAEKACEEVLALPIFPELGEDRLGRVVETIESFFA